MDKSKYPSKSWKKGDFLILSLLAPGWLLWILNEIFDKHAGRIHKYFVRATKFTTFEPLFTLGILLYIASHYGTVEDVALGTNWAYTRADDPKFKKFWWSLFFFNIGHFILSVKLWGRISKNLSDAKYLVKIETAGCLDDYGNPIQCSVEAD